METSSSASGLLPQHRVVSMQFRNWKEGHESVSGSPKMWVATGMVGEICLHPLPASGPPSLHSPLKWLPGGTY